MRAVGLVRWPLQTAFVRCAAGALIIRGGGERGGRTSLCSGFHALSWSGLHHHDYLRKKQHRATCQRKQVANVDPHGRQRNRGPQRLIVRCLNRRAPAVVILFSNHGCWSSYALPQQRVVAPFIAPASLSPPLISLRTPREGVLAMRFLSFYCTLSVWKTLSPFLYGERRIPPKYTQYLLVWVITSGRDSALVPTVHFSSFRLVV